MNGRTLTLVLCGDILPVRPLDALSAANREVFAAIAASDFSLGNFEMPVTDRGEPLEKLLTVRAPASIGPSLGALRLNVATLANNHAPDFGWTGLEDTRAALEAAGTACVGTGASLEEASHPLIATIDGIRIGVLAFSCLTPAGCGAAAGRHGLSTIPIVTGYEIDPSYQMEEPGDPSCVTVTTRVRLEDLERVSATVVAAREACDLLIVTLHWGFGSTDRLAQYQRPLAEALIEAGAHVVHGHHPHAVQAFGFHKGCPIVFSANVLVGQQVFLDASSQVQALWRDMSADGFLTRIHWIDGAVGEIEILPTVLDENRLPEFAKAGDADRIASRLSRLSPAQGAVVSRPDGRLLATPAPDMRVDTGGADPVLHTHDPHRPFHNRQQGYSP